MARILKGKGRRSSKSSLRSDKKKSLFFISENDFSRSNVIMGGVIRPLIQIVSFFSFIIAMFFLLFSLKASNSSFYLKWGGSGIVFAFVLNMYSIYMSLCDKPSIFKDMNLVFKFILFISEIIAFNWVLSYVLY